MEEYHKFFSTIGLSEKDISTFVKNNELNQIKLFINSLKTGDILYDDEQNLRKLCKLPVRKVQKGDINLIKTESGIIQLGRTNGRCRKNRKNFYYWSKLCINCDEKQASFPDEDGNQKKYCSECAKEKKCYKLLNPCKNCKKYQACYPDEDGNKRRYCSACAKEKGSYKKI